MPSECVSKQKLGPSLFLLFVCLFVSRKEGRLRIVQINIGSQVANKVSLYWISSAAYLVCGSCSGSEFKVIFSVCAT